MHDKIVRSVCCFTGSLETRIPALVQEIAQVLHAAGFVVQTQRVCCGGATVQETHEAYGGRSLYLSVGSLELEPAYRQLDSFLASDVAFNLDLSDSVRLDHVGLLFEIVRRRADKTFSFAYTFNSPPSTPFFPSARYAEDGFAIGLQPTDLAAGCETVSEWLDRLRTVWDEISALFGDDPRFLGIDSSIAPLYSGQSSLVHLIRRTHGSFAESVTRDVYLRMTCFLKRENPKPVGLCGIMFPCLEDFELAQEYERGEFSIERNVYLSLHSGLGIDTYPIGVDERPERVAEILTLLCGLSHRYDKPLSARFVSDGRARIGELTRFGNPYLRDVVVRPL